MIVAVISGGLLLAAVANHVWWHISEATFGLIVVAVITILGGRWTRRVEKKVDQTIDQTDTGNEKKLGTYVHDMAQTQEILSAQIHTNTRETVMAAEKAEQVRVKLEARIEVEDERSERIESKIDAHLVESKQVHEELRRGLGQLIEKVEGLGEAS